MGCGAAKRARCLRWTRSARDAFEGQLLDFDAAVRCQAVDEPIPRNRGALNARGRRAEPPGDDAGFWQVLEGLVPPAERLMLMKLRGG